MNQHNVTIYSAVWCPWCSKTKEWMNAHKIKYVNKDVDKDSKATEEMVRKSGQTGIPVTDIDGKIVVGYDVQIFQKLLNIKE